ncbi:MAG TPA: RluA family pseudouridine synthase [Caldithrix abyssi]|uniref:Pseudouridine synthase n=1 Tax=Caldithrix abyssi TaxID=187145 RepID=A0A7V5PQY5_CALAY|nr:RluA family pseudouridine synthase [Caldithrix abyssi]
MSDPISFQISPQESGTRLDVFLANRFPDHSRSYFHRLIKDRHVLVNERPVKSGYLLKPDDSVKVEFVFPQHDLKPVDIPLKIVYQDEHIVVIDKPAGMTVHPGKGTGEDTLVHALLYYVQNLSSGSGEERPGIVHRLDKFTSGLLVVAKNDRAHRILQEQFADKKIRRIYRAIVWGSLPEQGTVRTKIERSKKDPTKFVVSQRGKEAVTHFRRLRDFTYFSFAELQLETGRTHQIRIHMSHLYHPVLGDQTYGGGETQIKRLPPQLQKRGRQLLKLINRQALHAGELILIHPVSGQEMRFHSPLPEDMQTVLDKMPRLFMLT